MSIRAITFDCAFTLVDVRWDPGEFACECACEMGLSLDSEAAERYRQLYRARHGEFLQMNLLRDSGAARSFWTTLSRDWLDRSGLDAGQAAALMNIGDRRMYGPNSTVFRLYDDVIPVLEELSARGLPMAIISNWDISLHRVIEALGLSPYFKLVIASLEEGFEKPDARIFRLAVDHFGMAPQEILHIGDDPTDDLIGAQQAGFQALLLDRSRAEARLSSLAQLPSLIDALV